jgi:hypothetical protein
MTVLDRSVPVTDPTGGRDEPVRPSGRRGPTRLDLFALAGAASALVGAGIGAQRLSDNSFLTHLASGRVMVEHGVIRSDGLTWTGEGNAIVVQSWLASLLYGLVDAVAGLGGLRLMMAATAAVLAFLCWCLTARSSSLTTRALPMVPVLLVGLRTWSERPLLIGLVLFAVVLLVAEGRGRSPVLLVVGIVWVNIHGSWPLGLILLATRALGAALDSRAANRDMRLGQASGSVNPETPRRDLVSGAWLGLGLLVGGVANPYGPSLLLFPLRLLGRSDTLSLIAEWKSPSFDVDWARAFLLLVLISVVAVSRRSSWRLTLPLLVFVAAALVSRRNIPVATLVLLPALAHGLPAIGRLDGRRSSKAVRLATMTMAGLVVALPLLAVKAPHFDGTRYPEAALDAMDDADLSPESVRYVHQDFVGNYLGLRYEAPVAWIDDRFELHRPELVADYVVLLDAGSEWSEVLDRYDAEVLLWPSDAPLTQLVRDVAGWSVVYVDEDWSVLCRPDVAGC